MLNDSLISICQWIILAITCQTIDVFGVVSNAINIACFVKQGFKDPVNISLLGLAISDLGCLWTLLFSNICYTPAFTALSLPFDPTEFQYLISGIPHTAFTRVSACLTAVITLERCLCITAPLKVKTIVTRKRLSVTVVAMFVVLLFSMAPVYVVNRLDWKFYKGKNLTLIGLVYRHDREQVEGISFSINNGLVPFTAFIVITVSTIILHIKLKKATAWRMSKTSGVTENNFIRNQKVAKMVVMISVIFIACFIPVTFICIAMVLQPGLSLDGPYRHLLTILGGLAVCLESINSASNIFIYYSMSSNYRRALNQLCCRTVKQQRQ